MHTEVEPSSERAATGKVRVRSARAEDFPAIVDIYNWAIAHTVATFKTQPETIEQVRAAWERHGATYPWFVAELDGAVVGFTFASPFSNRCGLAGTAELTVYVHPEHTGRAVGKALYATVVSVLEAQGFKTLVGVIALPNPASVRLHEALGFVKVGQLRRVGWKHGCWHDIGYWQLVLNDSDDSPSPADASTGACTDGAGSCGDGA